MKQTRPPNDTQSVVVGNQMFQRSRCLKEEIACLWYLNRYYFGTHNSASATDHYLENEKPLCNFSWTGTGTNYLKGVREHLHRKLPPAARDIAAGKPRAVARTPCLVASCSAGILAGRRLGQELEQLRIER
jgi:hypothetical protein